MATIESEETPSTSHCIEDIAVASLKISRDLLQAIIVLAPGERLTPGDAMTLLSHRGVTVGIMTDAVMKLSTLMGPIEHVVAIGEPPVHGEDARIEYEFRTESPDLTPVIGESDRADYRNLGLFETVRPGQRLARLIPEMPGRDGRAVNGLRLAARKARELKVTAGHGTTLSPDGSGLYATVTGTPKLTGTTISVHQKLSLPGSVGLATGNIEFDGDLEIRGDVEVLMQVSVTGNVVIHGSVIGARVAAGGTVTVSGKVLQNSFVRAGSDLTVGFAEYVSLECGGKLRVRENLIHCQAHAAGAIEVGGSLVGGMAVTEDRITASSIGAPLGVPTIVRVEPNVKKQEELLAVTLERTEVRDKLVLLSERLRRARAHHSEFGPQALLDLITAFHQLADRNAELEARETALKAECSGVRCPVQARGGIHPEVDIQLGETHMRVTEAYMADATWEGRPVEMRG